MAIHVMPREITIARHCCATLKSWDKQMPTVRLFHSCKKHLVDINSASPLTNPEVRSVLTKLHQVGILNRSKRTGGHSWLWQMGTDAQYDVENPFKGKSVVMQKDRSQPNVQNLPAVQQGRPITDLELVKQVNELQKEVEQQRHVVLDFKKRLEEAEAVRKVEVTITHPDKTKMVMKEKLHCIFHEVLFHIKVGDSVMLVGPKGCGKTLLAEQLAKAMKLKFGMLSLSGGVTEGKLFGRVTPNVNKGTQEYQRPPFVEAYEEGGLFLLDEVDAADPNVLLSINGAMAGKNMPVERPKAPLAKRHKDFVCIAAANTWGNGGSRQYVGRNQQDSAFTERFVAIGMDYDHELEKQLCPGDEGQLLVKRWQTYRINLYNAKLEKTISTRLICRAYNWLLAGKDQSFCDERLFAGWTADEVRRVKGSGSYA